MMGEKEKRRKVDATAYMQCHFAPVPKSRGDVTDRHAVGLFDFECCMAFLSLSPLRWLSNTFTTSRFTRSLI